MARAGNIRGEALPDSVGPYTVVGPPRDSSGYCDFDAIHTVMGHRVLLRHEKWPSTLSGDPDGDALLRALRDARRLQAELRHPRILKVLDFLQVGGEWFTVFEHGGDRTLQQYTELIRTRNHRPLHVHEYVRICAGLTDALAAVHRAGYVHRTLNAHSVVVAENYEPTMTDLGCATPIGADEQETQLARRVLNPSTAAPEQFLDALTFTPATDLWALGAILYLLRYMRYPYPLSQGSGPLGLRALAGKLSFPSLRDASGKEIAGSTETLPGDGACLLADEERLIRPWLARLLEPDPTRRYQDANEVQRDLVAIGAQLEARPPMALAFVAMPFAREFDAIWRLIVSASLASRVRAIRIDQSATNESIWDEIRDQIEASDLMVAVASPQDGGVPNANVMLEIGYMRALHRPILILTTDPSSLPFDLRTQRAIRYAPGAEHDPRLHQDLCEILQALVARLPQPPSVSSRPTATIGGR